jgi:hypothetical protein
MSDTGVRTPICSEMRGLIEQASKEAWRDLLYSGARSASRKIVKRHALPAGVVPDDRMPVITVQIEWGELP